MKFKKFIKKLRFFVGVGLIISGIVTILPTLISKELSLIWKVIGVFICLIFIFIGKLLFVGSEIEL